MDKSTLLFIEANKQIPRGGMSSTARLGQEWFDAVKVGDIIALAVGEDGTPTESLGDALVVKKELVTYKQVLDTSYDSGDSKSKLITSLEAVYGADISTGEVFTKLHILPLDGLLPASSGYMRALAATKAGASSFQVSPEEYADLELLGFILDKTFIGLVIERAEKGAIIEQAGIAAKRG